MKTIITILSAIVLLSSAAQSAASVEEQNTWKETYPVETASPHLRISNIWGGVTVRAGESGQISVSAVEIRSAPDQGRFDHSFESIRLDI